MANKKDWAFLEIAHFHAWLIANLRVHSLQLRERFSKRLPTARELDNIVLLETLSNDVVNVSEHLFILFKMLLLVDRVAVNFENVSFAIFQKVGVDFVPRDASDLVRWMMMEALHGENRQRTIAEPGLGHRLLARSTVSLTSVLPDRSLRAN